MYIDDFCFYAVEAYGYNSRDWYVIELYGNLSEAKQKFSDLVQDGGYFDDPDESVFINPFLGLMQFEEEYLRGQDPDLINADEFWSSVDLTGNQT